MRKSSLLTLILVLSFVFIALELGNRAYAQDAAETPIARKITIISPGAGDIWQAGSKEAIRWETFDSFPSIDGEGKVKLYYSIDLLPAWIPIGCVDNTGEFLWNVPNIEAKHAKIRAEWVSDCSISSIIYASDESPEFKITPYKITILVPNGGEEWRAGDIREITWIASKPKGFVILLYSSDSGSTWVPVDCVQNPGIGGSYSWKVPDENTRNARIQIIWQDKCEDPAMIYAEDTSDSDFIIKPPYPEIPFAPSNLTATAFSSSGIKLSWTDRANNETGFRIERKTETGGYAEIATVTANVTTYTDETLLPDTRYYYRVRAYNDAGNSNYSNEANTRTEKPGQIIIRLYVGRVNYFVNNELKEMDVAPFIMEGRTLLPIRFVAEALGASVGWEPVERKVTITLDGKVIELWIEKNKARVNGEYKFIDPGNPNVVPIIIPPGRTMLPIRFVAENLDCKVDWDPALDELKITRYFYGKLMTLIENQQITTRLCRSQVSTWIR